jgi:hypothetical protein
MILSSMPLSSRYAHHANRARLNDRQRIHRLLSEDQHIERIAVVAERSRDESVVRRIVDGAVEHAIQTKESRLFVEFVFVRAAFGDFDDGRKRRGDLGVVYVAVVPGMHWT